VTSWHAQSRAWRTLTEWEILAISGPYNIADGHARGWLTSAHHDLMRNLRKIYESSVYTDQALIESQFANTFFRLTGQSEALNLEVSPIFGYSSSVCIDMAGALLFSLGKTNIGVVIPTFDNITALLQRRGLHLVPVPEDQIFNVTSDRLVVKGVDALFLVTPNNPTGRELSKEQLNQIATICESKGIPLLLDVSFRVFSDVAPWDLYSILHDHTSLEWITIEDTGKVWGLSELKAGFSLCSSSIRAELETLHNELRLNVSPFTLKLLETLMRQDLDGGPGHLSQLFSVIEQNKRRLVQTVKSLPYLEVVSNAKRSSVEWLRITCDDYDTNEICEALLKAGVVVLPGGPFFWNSPEEGRKYLRIALLRDVRYFARAIDLFAREWRHIFADKLLQWPQPTHFWSI
jgi:aspartate/methionine/tyrosine aminotransferase